MREDRNSDRLGVAAVYKSRWFVLILCAFMLFGSNYSYDLPASLNLELEAYLDVPHYQLYIQLLYSFYSIPNVVLPFFGGILIDTFGIPPMLMILSALVCSGQFFVAVGVSMKSLLSMLFGRLLLGVGSETLGVLQSQITARWFENKELALALGVNHSIGKIASLFSEVFTPIMASNYGINGPFWGAWFFCILSYLISIILAQIEVSNSHQAIGYIGMTTTFSRTFWLIIGIIVFLNGTSIPLNAIHSALLKAKFDRNDYGPSISYSIGIPALLLALLPPIIGFALDKYGYRAHILIACSTLMTFCHFNLAIASKNGFYSPHFLLFLLDFGYSVAMTVWSSIPLLVTPEMLGSAFGLATSASNMSSVFIPLLVGLLVTVDSSYTIAEGFFTLCSLIGLALAAYLNWDDFTSENKLRLPQHLQKKHVNIIQDDCLDDFELEDLDNYRLLS